LLSFSGYIRAKILLEAGDYEDIVKECSKEIEASQEHGEGGEDDKGNSSC